MLTSIIPLLTIISSYTVIELPGFKEIRGITESGVVFGLAEDGTLALKFQRPDFRVQASRWLHFELGDWTEFPLPVNYLQRFSIEDLSDSGVAVGSFSDTILGTNPYPASIADGVLRTIGPITRVKLESSMNLGSRLVAVNERGTAVGYGRVTTEQDENASFPLVYYARTTNVWFPTVEDHEVQGMIYDVNKGGLAVGHQTYGHQPLVIDTESRLIQTFPRTLSFSFFHKVLDDNRALWINDDPYGLIDSLSPLPSRARQMTIDEVSVSRVYDVNNYGTMLVRGIKARTTEFFGLIEEGKTVDLAPYLRGTKGFLRAAINDKGTVLVDTDPPLLLKRKDR